MVSLDRAAFARGVRDVINTVAVGVFVGFLLSCLLFFLAFMWALFAHSANAAAMVQAGSDTIELRPPTPQCQCVGFLHYENGISNFSQGGDYTVERDGITIRVHLQVSGQDETLTIYQDGFMALLDGEVIESVDVTDGESVTLRLLPPMF